MIERGAGDTGLAVLDRDMALKRWVMPVAPASAAAITVS